MALMSDREENVATAAIVGYAIAGLATFFVTAWNTWASDDSVMVKAYNTVFVNLFDAAVWPVAWLMWAVHYVTGFDIGSPSLLTSWIF